MSNVSLNWGQMTPEEPESDALEKFLHSEFRLLNSRFLLVILNFVYHGEY